MKSDKLVNAIGNIKDEYITEAHAGKSKKQWLSWNSFGKFAAAACVLLLAISILPTFFSRFDSKDSGTYSSGSYNYAYEDYDAYVEEAPAEAYVTSGAGSAEAKQTLKQNQKLILNGYLSMESQQLDELITLLNEKTTAAGGYMQSTSISQNYDGTRSYSATIRIPAENYSSFVDTISGSGNTISYQESVRDVTDSYTDIQARLNSLKAQEAKVLEFYDKAVDIEDLMSIESRLSDIQYEIEYLETQIRNYDLLIAYSTLEITVKETKVYTPVNQSFFTRLGKAFTNGFHNFISGLGDFIVDLVYNIWTIILLAGIAALVIFVYRKIKKHRNKI